MVSEKRYEFILYDKQLLSMTMNPSKYRRVKYRNSRGKEAIGYPAGEIWGMFEVYNGGNHARISICIGPNGEDIETNDSKELINLSRKYVFLLPIEDFKKFIGVLELMKDQKDRFKEFLEDAEMEIETD
jgi:hypothetical protein